MEDSRNFWNRGLYLISGFGWQHRIFLAIQFAVLLWALHLWRSVPEVGTSVGILAVVAAAMSLHGEMKTWQKFIWMLLLCVLLRIELRAIKKQSDDSREVATGALRQQQESFQKVLDRQKEDFQSTANKLEYANTENKLQFDASMQRMRRVLKETQNANSLTAENLRSTIGDSYTPYFMVGNFPNSDIWEMWLFNESKHPIRDLQIQVRDVNLMLNLFESRTPHSFYLDDEQIDNRRFSFGDVGPGLVLKSSYSKPTARGNDVAFLRFECSSLAGAWSEVLILRRDSSGKVYSAMAIPGGMAKVDVGFPRNAQGKIGWGHVGVRGYDD